MLPIRDDTELCVVCFCPHRDTALLPCCHQFHGACLRQSRKEGYPGCPLCHQPIHAAKTLSQASVCEVFCLFLMLALMIIGVCTCAVTLLISPVEADTFEPYILMSKAYGGGSKGFESFTSQFARNSFYEDMGRLWMKRQLEAAVEAETPPNLSPSEVQELQDKFQREATSKAPKTLRIGSTPTYGTEVVAYEPGRIPQQANSILPLVIDTVILTSLVSGLVLAIAACMTA